MLVILQVKDRRHQCNVADSSYKSKHLILQHPFVKIQASRDNENKLTRLRFHVALQLLVNVRRYSKVVKVVKHRLDELAMDHKTY